MKVLIALIALWQPGVAASAPDLNTLASAARAAFQNQAFERLFDPAQTVRLELPRRPVGPMVRGPAAAAALAEFARRALDREVDLVKAEVVETRQALIELVRRYRLAGTGQQQRDRVLLSAVLERGVWRLSEVMVVEVLEPR